MIDEETVSYEEHFGETKVGVLEFVAELIGGLVYLVALSVLPISLAVFAGPVVGEMLLAPYAAGAPAGATAALGAITTFVGTAYLQQSYLST